MNPNQVEFAIKIVTGEVEPNFDNMYDDLMVAYLSDPNSSTMRQLVTAKMCGYESSTEKLGYDARSGSRNVEIKPVNVQSSKIEIVEKEEENEFCQWVSREEVEESSPRKLCGSGNYSDLCWEKHDRFIRENPIVITSGFCDGMNLIYIVELSYTDIADRLAEQLELSLPGRIDVVGKWRRSSSFSYLNYCNSPNIKKIYVRKDIRKFKDVINSDFYKFLKSPASKVIVGS